MTGSVIGFFMIYINHRTKYKYDHGWWVGNCVEEGDLGSPCGEAEEMHEKYQCFDQN